MATDRMSLLSAISQSRGLSDDEFLRGLSWRKSADARLKAAAESGDSREFGRALSRTLKAVKPSRQHKLSTPPLLQPLWSRHAFDKSVETERGANFLKEMQRCLTSGKSAAKSQSKRNRLVERELADASSLKDSPWSALQWLTILAEVGRKLSPQVLFGLWRTTLEATSVITRDTHGSGDPDDRILLADGELPWRTGLCFRDLRGAGKLQKAGVSCLREGLEQLTDGDGTPHASSLHRLPLMLAVLSRSIHAGNAAGESLWNASAAGRFESLVNRAAALSGADGSIALSNGASFAPASLLRTASQLAGQSKREPSAQRLRSLPDDLQNSRSQSGKKTPLVARRTRLPNFDDNQSPSSHSDWAELACLRNNWLTGADSCIVTHHQPRPQICLTAFERVLINGDWPVEVRLDGKPADLHQDWSCVCWFSDEDADYFELQLDADGVTLCRQVMLSRTDHWLFVADAAFAEQADTIELSTRLPLADGVTAEASRWTREISLSQQKLKAAVYPLALDQQRVTHTHGSLDEQTGEIVLQQRGAGTAVYAPLVIDWSPARRRSQAQWRKLTVAEDGAILSADAAAAFRLRVGKYQWLYYRSLRAGETARTVLGHHTPHETVIAEFTTDGAVEPLVIVE